MLNLIKFLAKLKNILSSQIVKYITSTHWFKNQQLSPREIGDSPEAKNLVVTVCYPVFGGETRRRLYNVFYRYMEDFGRRVSEVICQCKFLLMKD